MDGELLEVREVHSAARRRIEARILSPRKRPLDDSVRNTETLRERPVAPRPIVDEQPAEDIDIGILDHDILYQVSILDTQPQFVYFGPGLNSRPDATAARSSGLLGAITPGADTDRCRSCGAPQTCRRVGG